MLRLPILPGCSGGHANKDLFFACEFNDGAGYFLREEIGVNRKQETRGCRPAGELNRVGCFQLRQLKPRD
jgi:hypothetical protein